MEEGVTEVYSCKLMIRLPGTDLPPAGLRGKHVVLLSYNREDCVGSCLL